MAFDSTIDNEAQEIYFSFDQETRNTIKKDVNMFAKNLVNENAILLSNIKKYMNDRPNMSKAERIENLETDLKNLTGDFNTYEKGVLNQAKQLSYKVQQEIYEKDLNEQFGYNQNTKYMWQAVFIRTCPSCIELHGTVKTLRGWDKVGHPKEYPTICKTNCQCILIPIESVPNRVELRKPILVESNRIRKAEKKRGKKYSPSYRSQIIGNLNNSEFRKTMRDLRKIKKVS